MELMPVQSTKPVSKFALSNLALDSALELGKARSGERFDETPLIRLAEALTTTSQPQSSGAPFKFVEPGYYESFERLYRSQHASTPGSVEQLQEFFGQEIRKLEATKHQMPDGEVLAELARFCISLHRELIRAMASETRVASRNWRTADRAASSRFS